MGLDTISSLIEKYKLTNMFKIVLLLILLYLAYRIFINNDTNYNDIKYNKLNFLNNNTSHHIIEGFFAGTMDSFNTEIYGNVLSLQEPKNIPIYSNNTCILTLDNIYRIDSLIINFNSLLNSNTSSATTPYSKSGENSSSIFIQFLDGNGNMRNLKSGISISNNDSPYDYKTDTKIDSSSKTILNLALITDENGLAVYTSKIIITIGTKTNDISTYFDANKNGYISTFGIYGGTRELMSYNDYKLLLSTLNSYSMSLKQNTTPAPTQSKTSSLIFTTARNNDILIYSLKLKYTELTSISQQSVANPFSISITYENAIYPNNDFTIDNNYYIRNDINSLLTSQSFIYFIQPIIANKITLTITNPISTTIIGSSTNYKSITITEINANGKIPITDDITNYKQIVNTLKQTSGSDNTLNICPNINVIADTQSKTQLICDNLEYQDKVKTEKLRLERNKQYLLKLQEQQSQVDQLNLVIQDLENKRQLRDTSGDQVRVLQYQKQKSDASTIRDLANQRIDSQANNQLYMDVSLN